VVGDSVYVFGGQAGAASSNVVVATALADGGLSAWRPTTSLPRPRWGHASTTAGQRVFVAGGQPDDTGSQEPLPEVLAADALADGGLSAWQRVGTLGVGRRNFTLLASGGVVLAVGGVGSSGVRFDDVEAAPLLDDGTLGPFVPVARFPLARRHPVAALVGDRLLVGTGVGPPVQTHFADVWLTRLTLPRAVGAWTTLVDLGPETVFIDAFEVRTGGIGRVRAESAVLGLDGGFEPAVAHGDVLPGALVTLARPGRGLRLSLAFDESSAFARDVDAGRFGVDAIEVHSRVLDAGTPDAGAPDAGVPDAGADAGVTEGQDAGGERPRESYAVGCACRGGDGTPVLVLLLLAVWRRRR
jgi:MYXO-CTERM domain-containing protein